MKEWTKKFLEKLGVSGAVIGAVGFGLVISILEIIFIWGTGIAMVYFGITLLLEGSILWGLIVLFIGTPVAVAIASFLFPFWVIFLVIWGIIWLIAKIF